MAYRLSHQFIPSDRSNGNYNKIIDQNNQLILQKIQQRYNPKPIYGKKQNGDETPDKINKTVTERYKTYTWDKTFIYNYLDTRLLKSVFMDNNKYFQDCVNLINSYNEEVSKSKNSKDEIKHGPWKMRLFSTLYNLLREVILTSDRTLQRNFAQEVNKWAYQQIDTIESDQKEVKPFEGDLGFMLNTIRGVQRDFNKYQKSSTSRERSSKSLDKQKTVAFTANTLPNVNDESSFMGNNKTFLDETRDQTTLDARLQTPEKEESVISESHFKVTSILSQSGQRRRMKQPSEYAAEQLKDYKSNARTIHPEYEPPKIRLKEYKRRVLSFDDPSKFHSKLKSDSLKQESEFSRVTYPKPLTLDEIKKQKQYEEQAALEEKRRAEGEGENKDYSREGSVIVQDGELRGESQVGLKDLDISGILEKQDEEQLKKPPLQPDIKNFTLDENGKETFIRDLNKKYDTRSKYIYYEPSDDVREIRMENKWLEGRQKELMEKRENEEMIKMVQEWSLAKGRIEKEINRKIDSNIDGSKFLDCEYRFTKKTADELKQLDVITKEAALKQNALEEIKENEDKKKKIEQKKKERKERRKEREEKRQKKKKHDSDSDKEGKYSDGDSFDEDLDGPFDPTNPKFKKKRFHSLHAALSKSEQKSVDLTTALPRIAKPQFQTPQKQFKGLEYEASRQKIELMKRLHVGGNTVNGQVQSQSAAKPESQSESSNSFYKDSYIHNSEKKEPIQPSLSIYSRDIIQKLRPFSAIFEKADISVVQNEQLAEIHEVKNRMAKYKITIPYKKLQTAIIVPEGLTNQEDLEQIPDPGQGLISNPFMEDKKKKKKKKKK